MLRGYQQRAIDMLYAWFEANPVGNPCLELPTGAGKSHIIAALIKDAIQSWPETRILMLTHQKELLEQNAEKLRQHWRNAPLGIYSASIGKRQLGEPITFAGIQSVRKKAELLGHADIVLIDECHLVGHTDEGGYRKLLGDLQKINPALRVIGLTATPYRLGHGMITDKPALFDALVSPVSIEELVYKGFLSKLRSRPTEAKLETAGLHKRGGEFIESEMQEAFDTDANNAAVVDEVIACAGGRKSWLLFCAGVKHAENVALALCARGIVAECVTGETTKKERERILSEFKAGKIQALTNANVLTTGFDAPNIDLIALLRATMSPALYVQMAGRGLRIAPEKSDCLVLDFAGVVETHGPITNIKPPKRGGLKGDGAAPVKVCPNCGDFVAISASQCGCGYRFPPPERAPLALRDVDIMGEEVPEMAVKSWAWSGHTSRTSGKHMLKCTYYGGLSDAPVTEYHAVTHEGFAGQKALRELWKIAQAAGCSNDPDFVSLRFTDTEDDDELCARLKTAALILTASNQPKSIGYQKDGKFVRIIGRTW